jgi:ABC-2 type transport system ATP-binding protein
MKMQLLLAMAFRPKLLVLDEPFSGLDVLSKEQLISSLLEVTEQDQWSVAIASHDLAELERLADVIGLIEDGRLMISEPIEQLQSRFRRVQIFGETNAPIDGGTILQPEHSEGGTRFIETQFSPARQQQLTERFGTAIEFTPLPLREIILALFSANLEPL